MTSRVWPAAAAAVASIQVGSAMVATRLVVDQTGPASLALLRYVLGACCLVPAMLVNRSHARFAPRDVAPIAFLGIAQFGVLIAVLNFGLRSVPSARAALIFATDSSRPDPVSRRSAGWRWRSSGSVAAVATYLWLWALQQATPTRVTAFLALSPVTAAALGTWLLGEPVTPLAALGLASVATGLAVAHLDSERRRAL